MTGRPGGPGGPDAGARVRPGGPVRPGGGPGMMAWAWASPWPRPSRSDPPSCDCWASCGRRRPGSRWCILLAIGSVFFLILGPKLLGEATNVVVAGLFPGSGGLDSAALAGVLVKLAGVYVLSSILAWAQAWVMAGVTQRTVYRLRQEVDRKLGRLPLKTFDSRPRGDLLSRVTNDIDNIGATLQQSLTQLITALLTIVGVLIMMLTISPLLALISILAVPLSLFITAMIAKRSQPQFVVQWASTGSLNGHIEEMHTGHSIVKLFGRQQQAIETFRTENERLYEASRKAQFISGTIQPALNFVSNLNYVAIAVIGGLQVAAGADVPGRRRGVHPVRPPVHDAHHPDSQHRQPHPVGRRVRGAGVRAAGRDGGDPRSGGAHEPSIDARGGVRFAGRVLPVPGGHAAHRRTSTSTWRPAARWPSWARPVRARRPSSTS